MRLPRPFSEKVRDNYQRTSESAKRHRRANGLAFLAALGVVTVIVNSALESDKQPEANRYVDDIAALEIVVTTLGIAAASSSRDKLQIPEDLTQSNGKKTIGELATGVFLATPDEL